MGFLQCECGSFLKGIQLSRKVVEIGEYRDVAYKVGASLEAETWNTIDNKNQWLLERVDGVYCPVCHNEIQIETQEKTVLLDNRIPGIGSGEFKTNAIVEKLKVLSKKERAEIYIHQTPESDPVFGKINEDLPNYLQHSLERMGISSLYCHQADTYNAVRENKDVVLVTHTASGKTLSFNLPILQGLIENPEAKALYIFPTKALADDQVEQLYRWTESYEKNEEQDEWFERTIKLGDSFISYGRIDGDTQLGSRRRLIKDGRILFTNPDMIHHSLLKQVQGTHRSSAHIKDIFRNLRYIVVDEMHLYRGAFGTHVSHVLRRLQQICFELGNKNIQFILCSATIDKPTLLAQELTGRKDFQLVDKDGSAKRNRSVIFWNPGTTLDTGGRKAPISDAIAIAEDILVQNEKVIRSILFQGSRLQGKVTARSLKDVLRKKLKLSRDSVSGVKLAAFYNGMLTVDERKQVINAIKKSDVHLVIATNSLEVGIDIGDLSFAILIGYPGSKAAFSQQIGRVGRKGEGVAVLIFEDEPLQQYYMQNPNLFLEKAPEVVRIDPKNKELLKLHLSYLQEELGRELKIDDLVLFESNEEEAKFLLDQFVINEQDERCSLRSISSASFKVVTTNSRQVLLDGVDEWTALRDFHEGAIYWNANEKAYVVDSYNRKKLEIIVKPIKGDIEYYTQSIYKDVISVIEVKSNEELSELDLSFGMLNIKRNVFGFVKSYFNSRVQENVNLDKALTAQFQDEGFWLTLSNDTVRNLTNYLGDDFTSAKLEGSVRATEHVLLSIIPDTIICDGNDIASFSGLNHSGFENRPVLGFYGQSGGMGLTKAINENLERITQSALHLINTCKCTGGCPSCIQYPGKDNENLSKTGAKHLLNVIEKQFKSLAAEVKR